MRITCLVLLAPLWVQGAMTPLEVGKAIARESGPGSSEEFVLEAAARQFVHVVVSKKGVDVSVSVVGTDHVQVLLVHSPNGVMGPVPVSWIAEKDGAYTVRVAKSSASTETGKYEIEWVAARLPTDRDRRQIQAERTFAEALAEDSQWSTEHRKRALDLYQQSRELWHGLGDGVEEGLCLYRIGVFYSGFGDKEKALVTYNQALAIRRSAGDQSGVADTLNDIGSLLSQRGEKQEGLKFLNQALALRRELGERAGEARALSDIGGVYDDLGDRQQALQYFNQALPIAREVGDRADEADTLRNIGMAYDGMGERRKAVSYFDDALTIARKRGDPASEAYLLGDLAGAYSFLGEKQKALEHHQQARALQQKLGDRAGEALTLASIGVIYKELGDTKNALDYYEQALPIMRAVSDKTGEALTIRLIGVVYSDLDQKERALENLQQALPMLREVGDRESEAVVLADIGNLYNRQGEKQKALGYYNRSLPLIRAAGSRDSEAITLDDIGTIYFDQGDTAKAMEYFEQALPILRELGDRSGEAATLANMRRGFEKTAPGLAVLFGKQAVNTVQGLRRDNQGLNQELRASYEKSIESYYRSLANLLVGLSRFGEAEEVLNLLKEKESFDYIRRDSVADKLRPATLLPFEQAALKRYDEIVDGIVKIGQRKAELLAKRKAGLTDVEAAESARLDGDLSAANTVLGRFLAEQEKEFAPGSAVAKEAADLRQTESVQKSLQKLGSTAVAIYTLVADDRYVAILVTSGARKAYTSKITQKDLNAKLFAFRQALQNPGSNPLPAAQELYGILLPEGLRADLESIGATSVMWSLDSTLRYVPIGALHDGKQYLVERFRNSLITPESLESLTEENSGEWQGVGFGVSAAHGEFSALPSVPAELRHIFRGGGAEGGPVAGLVRLDGDFRKETFQHDMTARVNPIVHIATHFDARPGVAANSALLLGDGTTFSLAEIEASGNLFANVDLVTLSACSTGFQIGSADGREVDNLGTIAQRLGAKGVIASLWNVSDEATAVLMQKLYQNWKDHPQTGKGEALRLAQAEMAEGKVGPGAGSGVGRGVSAAGSREGMRSWTHPYYWASFILIGNWK